MPTASTSATDCQIGSVPPSTEEGGIGRHDRCAPRPTVAIRTRSDRTGGPRTQGRGRVAPGGPRARPKGRESSDATFPSLSHRRLAPRGPVRATRGLRSNSHGLGEVCEYAIRPSDRAPMGLDGISATAAETPAYRGAPVRERPRPPTALPSAGVLTARWTRRATRRPFRPLVEVTGFRRDDSASTDHPLVLVA